VKRKWFHGCHLVNTLPSVKAEPNPHSASLSSFILIGQWMATSANAFCGGHSPFLCPVPSVLLSSLLSCLVLQFHFPHQSFRTIETENHACSVTDCTVLSHEDYLLLVLSNIKKQDNVPPELFWHYSLS